MWRHQRTPIVLVAACILVFLLVAGYTLSDESPVQIRNHFFQLGNHADSGAQDVVPHTEAESGAEAEDSSSTSRPDEEKEPPNSDAQRAPDKPAGDSVTATTASQQPEGTDSSKDAGESGSSSDPSKDAGESGSPSDPNTESHNSRPLTDDDTPEESEQSGWRKVGSRPYHTGVPLAQTQLEQSQASEDSSAHKDSHPVDDYAEFSKTIVKETPNFGAELEDAKSAVSYDKTTPPSVGCEDIVAELQNMVIETYSRELKGIQYVHVFGLLDATENKGDAAIWVAQEILLATLGIKTMQACRYIDKDCDVEKWKKDLEKHAPHSGIIMAGGGNFNDMFEVDHPARLKMVKEYGDRWPIRMFPQSINLTTTKWTEQTLETFAHAKNVQLAARDLPSYKWLTKAFGTDEASGARVGNVTQTLSPDVAFMFGNRPDIRLNTKKTHDIYILARDDNEVAEGDSSEMPVGEGVFDLGPDAGDVTYLKNDWRWIKSPMNGAKGPSHRAWAKAMYGFEMLASAEFVITDRLHGHIMSTLMGIPHVLMDSKLKKNLFLHNTWTKDCDCVRVADSIEEAIEIAQLYFEKQTRDGHRKKKTIEGKPQR